MKKSPIIASALILAFIAGTTPAAALSFGTKADVNVGSDAASVQSSTNVNASRNDDKRDNSSKWSNDDRSNSSQQYWKSWSFNGGIMGTVTAVSGDTITVKAANGTSYSVDTSDATIRSANNAAITTGDNVYVQGITKDNTIVATLVVNGKAQTATPNDDDKRMAIAGTVTAKSGTTLTVLGKNGNTYTVAAANAAVWEKGNQDSSVANIDIGDSVVVQGTVSGSSVTATRIHAVSFPSTSANGGIRGTVTAVNGDTFTLMIAGGTTYTVDADSADFKGRKGAEQQMEDIKVGETVVVTGDVSGSTIDAEVVSETKVNKGFFYRVGNFFKSIFGKGNAKADVNANVN